MEFLLKESITLRQALLLVLHTNGTTPKSVRPSPNGELLLGRCRMENEELRNKRRELELSLANQFQMSDRSKEELIRKILDVLEDAMEDDEKLDID